MGDLEHVIDRHDIVLIDWDKPLHGLRHVTNQNVTLLIKIYFFFKVRFESFREHSSAVETP